MRRNENNAGISAEDIQFNQRGTVTRIDYLLNNYLQSKQDRESRFNNVSSIIDQNTPYANTYFRIMADSSKQVEETLVLGINRLNQLGFNPLNFPLSMNGDLLNGNLAAIGKGLVDFKESQVDWRTLSPYDQERLYWEKYNYAEFIQEATGFRNPYKQG